MEQLVCEDDRRWRLNCLVLQLASARLVLQELMQDRHELTPEVQGTFMAWLGEHPLLQVTPMAWKARQRLLKHMLSLAESQEQELVEELLEPYLQCMAQPQMPGLWCYKSYAYGPRSKGPLADQSMATHAAAVAQGLRACDALPRDRYFEDRPPPFQRRPCLLPAINLPSHNNMAADLVPAGPDCSGVVRPPLVIDKVGIVSAAGLDAGEHTSYEQSGSHDVCMEAGSNHGTADAAAAVRQQHNSMLAAVDGQAASMHVASKVTVQAVQRTTSPPARQEQPPVHRVQSCSVDLRGNGDIDDTWSIDFAAFGGVASVAPASPSLASASHDLQQQQQQQQQQADVVVNDRLACDAATVAEPISGWVTLQLSQNMLEGGTGCHEWEAGFLLGSWVLNNPHLFRGRSVLDIGCGAGLVGICLARVGPQKVLLTDGDVQTLVNCHRNLRINGVHAAPLPHFSPGIGRASGVVEGAVPPPVAAEGTSGQDALHSTTESVVQQLENVRSNIFKPHFACSRLTWDDGPSFSDLEYDVFLGSDLLYDPRAIPALVNLLTCLLSGPSGSSTCDGGAVQLGAVAAGSCTSLSCDVENHSNDALDVSNACKNSCSAGPPATANLPAEAVVSNEHRNGCSMGPTTAQLATTTAKSSRLTTPNAGPGSEAVNGTGVPLGQPFRTGCSKGAALPLQKLNLNPKKVCSDVQNAALASVLAAKHRMPAAQPSLQHSLGLSHVCKHPYTPGAASQATEQHNSQHQTTPLLPTAVPVQSPGWNPPAQDSSLRRRVAYIATAVRNHGTMREFLQYAASKGLHVVDVTAEALAGEVHFWHTTVASAHQQQQIVLHEIWLASEVMT